MGCCNALSYSSSSGFGKPQTDGQLPGPQNAIQLRIAVRGLGGIGVVVVVVGGLVKFMQEYVSAAGSSFQNNTCYMCTVHIHISKQRLSTCTLFNYC